MLKKLLNIGMLACAMTFACSAYAQNEGKSTLEYPRYGFWSNWSLGGELLYNWEYEKGNPFSWREGTNLGLGIFAEKELNHVFAVRGAFVLPGLWRGLTNDEGVAYDRYGKLGVDAKISFTGLRRGYVPEMNHSFYGVLGAGVSGDYKREELGILGVYIQAGLGYSHDICKHSSIFVEYVHDVISNAPNFIKGNWDYMNGTLALGWMYNFGPTASDMDMIAQSAELTQETFDAKNSELEGLRRDLNDAKQKEQRLVNRINELEANQTQTVVKADDGVADSLRRVIEGYETNKHNFYAMPFSILYGVDEYTVSDDQMGKIKAIAQIMKDNEDVNFEIIGYCDYSGSDAYNQKLSEKRAENVKKLLVNRYGIDEDRLTTSGKGKSMSFGDIKNAVNRRVSFYRTNK